MMILLAIVVFIIILGILVFVHELGHFIMAKRAGMRVEEFGFGFPPRIFGIQKGETLYSINWIPLGGFVKIVGEDGSDSPDPESFGNKSFWQRFFVLLAGVTMNVILAWVLISIGMGLGLPTVLDEGDQLPASAHIKNQTIGILEVEAKTPAADAGLKPGDSITKINGQPVGSIQDTQTATLADAGKPTIFTIKRGSEIFDKTITPRVNPPSGEGSLGVALGSVAYVSYPWYQAPYRGGIAVINLIILTVTTFASLIGQFFQGHNVGAQLSGPVGIAVLTKDVTALGFIYLLQFTAVLSVNLAIINAVPFPALDGGRVLFLIIEKIRGKKMPIRAEIWANTIGFMLLLLLMVVVTVHDVGHYSTQFKNLFHRIF
ncbi:MAG: M50 family metallopeptidase [Candidatus Doudnabacteria bacterium]